jgi:amino acid transporter
MSNGWAETVILISFLGQIFCGMACVTSCSRTFYAFSRDRAVPGWQLWTRLDKKHVPLWSVIGVCALALIMTLPALWNVEGGGVPIAFFAVVSISVIGLYIAYVIPTFLRLLARDKFKPGPWNLGKWSYLVGWIAVVWVVFICIILMLPQLSPGGLGLKKIDALNYAPIAVGAVIVLAGGWYLISARKWFKGPKVQGTTEELAEIEADLERV